MSLLMTMSIVFVSLMIANEPPAIMTKKMSDAMLTNFIACGGVLSIAAGMRMAKIHQYPVIDMLPALALILVLTPLWERLFPMR